MSLNPNDVIGGVLKLITEGSVLGLPTAAFMTMPFVVGLIIGFMIKKALKIVAIAVVAIGAGLYFGVLNIQDLKVAGTNLITVYGEQVKQYVMLLIGLIPLGSGLAVGLILGLKYG